MHKAAPQTHISIAAHLPLAGSQGSASRRAFLQFLRIAYVRLRFPIVLLALFLVVGKWDVLRNYWDTWTLGAAARNPNDQAASGDTEYFCPMDPGVLSDWPAKCSICNMALVRRKKGHVTPLPEGVVARMQLSPYRVQLAGIRTSLAEYRPLVYQLEGLGRVLLPDDDRTAAPIVAWELPQTSLEVLRHAQGVVVRTDHAPGAAELAGHITQIQAGHGGSLRLLATVDDFDGLLLADMLVSVRTEVPAAGLEPFKSDSPPGEVLAVPASAVVDTGREQLVYVDRGGGMFDGVLVELGRRCGEWYPVTGGLAAGDRVATVGALLLDAETRLNPSLAAGYFGASRPATADAASDIGTSTAESEPETAEPETADDEQAISAALAELPPSESALARRQRLCPVTGLRLGSMGKPIVVHVAGRDAWICCSACEAKLRAKPDQYLSKLP